MDHPYIFYHTIYHFLLFFWLLQKWDTILCARVPCRLRLPVFPGVPELLLSQLLPGHMIWISDRPDPPFPAETTPFPLPNFNLSSIVPLTPLLFVSIFPFSFFISVVALSRASPSP